MPAGNDLIFFDAAEDWELATQQTRTAVILGENSYEPIPAFTLGLSLNTDYVAVIATTNSGRPTWQFAGDINQVYRFPVALSNPLLGNIQPIRTRIFLNKLTLVETNRVSTDSFDLRYSPPYWFRDCAIRVYLYTGDKLNFVEDSLFDIGNALGIDPNNPSGLLALGLASLRDDIDSSISELKEQLEDLDNASENTQLQLLEQINQLDAGVYTLAEGLADLLPNDRGNQIKQQAQNRLDLDLGFL